MSHILRDKPYLIISDLQIPFEHGKALEFCKYLQKHYRIPTDRIYNVGDEVDQYFGGLWDKDPNGHHTALSEIQECKDTLKQWYSAFPKMRLCTSNHGSRWIRKATQAQIPAFMMKEYQSVIEAPRGWVWKKHWLVKEKKPFLIEHGDDWGGQHPHLQAIMHNGMSTIMGHHHSLFVVQSIVTAMQDIFGAVIGSLIDFEAYAFNYARSAKKKPVLGAMVVADRGSKPILERLYEGK